MVIAVVIVVSVRGIVLDEGIIVIVIGLMVVDE